MKTIVTAGFIALSTLTFANGANIEPQICEPKKERIIYTGNITTTIVATVYNLFK